MRGRVFATLFALMRIGLFIAMAIAVPLRRMFASINVDWLFSQPTRTVLLVGGVVMVTAGLGILWTLRGLFRPSGLGDEAKYVISEASRARRFPLHGDGEAGDEAEAES